jgi:hypothetical protein
MVTLYMMTFINWESLLKITHAENYLVVFLIQRLILVTSHYEHLKKTGADCGILDSDINALILDYLTTEGYPSAAARFSKEANLRPQQEEESVKARRQIQHSIHSGDIQEAVDTLNELEPQVSRRIFLSFHFFCHD